MLSVKNVAFTGKVEIILDKKGLSKASKDGLTVGANRVARDLSILRPSIDLYEACENTPDVKLTLTSKSSVGFKPSMVMRIERKSLPTQDIPIDDNNSNIKGTLTNILLAGLVEKNTTKADIIEGLSSVISGSNYLNSLLS